MTRTNRLTEATASSRPPEDGNKTRKCQFREWKIAGFVDAERADAWARGWRRSGKEVVVREQGAKIAVRQRIHATWTSITPQEK
jgi:hypothetical protein